MFDQFTYARRITHLMEGCLESLKIYFPHIAWRIEYPEASRVMARFVGHIPSKAPDAEAVIFALNLGQQVGPDRFAFFADDLCPLRNYRVFVTDQGPHWKDTLALDLKATLAAEQDRLAHARQRLNVLQGAEPAGIGTTVTVQHRNGIKETIYGVDASETSDGSHTFGELYDHRYWLFLALGRQYINQFAPSEVPTRAWISQKHADGTMYPNYFIAGLQLEDGTHLTYHLPLNLEAKASVDRASQGASQGDGESSLPPISLSLWDAAIEAGFTPCDNAPPWDGKHDAIDKLWALSLARPKPKRKLIARWLMGCCWELRDEDTGELVSTSSRSDTPDEAEEQFQKACPDAVIEMDTSSFDAYLRDFCNG